LGEELTFEITDHREGYAMTQPAVDQRGPGRRARDEQIAAEPQLPPLELPPDATPAPVEAHLGRLRRRPVAVAGVVENGLVRPLDPTVKLPEHARVIIVAAENAAYEH
jgi:hypothetical protein